MRIQKNVCNISITHIIIINLNYLSSSVHLGDKKERNSRNFVLLF